MTVCDFVSLMVGFVDGIFSEWKCTIFGAQSHGKLRELYVVFTDSGCNWRLSGGVVFLDDELDEGDCRGRGK